MESFFFMDISGQLIMSLSYGGDDMKVVMTFRNDDFPLIQDFVCKCEQFLNDKYLQG